MSKLRRLIEFLRKPRCRAAVQEGEDEPSDLILGERPRTQLSAIIKAKATTREISLRIRDKVKTAFNRQKAGPNAGDAELKIIKQDEETTQNTATNLEVDSVKVSPLWRFFKTISKPRCCGGIDELNKEDPSQSVLADGTKKEKAKAGRKGLFGYLKEKAQVILSKATTGVNALKEWGDAVGKKLASSKLFGSRFRKLKTLFGGFGRKSAVQRAVDQARSLALHHELADMQALARQITSGGVMRGEYFMTKTLQDRMDYLRRLREEEERRRAWEQACHEARLKYSKLYAQNLWNNLYDWVGTDGVKRIIAYREHLEYLRLRRIRVLDAFGRFARRLEIRRRAAVLSRVFLMRITLKSVFADHDRRQDAARDIQCAFRVLIARRVFLMAYIEQESRMLDLEKDYVWEKWAARLARAVKSIAHVETEAHRQARRRVWARTEFSRALAEKHFLTYGNPPGRDPPAVTSFQKPCDGSVALKLPDTEASKIVAPIGDDTPEAERLNWIGVPIGVSANQKRFDPKHIRSSNNHPPRRSQQSPAKKTKPRDHFSLVYMPLPTHLLGVSLKDSRSRQKAQEDLSALKAAALRPNQHIQPAPGPASNWYEQEQDDLWRNRTSLLTTSFDSRP